MQLAVIPILILTSIVIVESHTGHTVNEQIKRAREIQQTTHQYLNQICDYKLYEEEMIPFWHDFFKERTSLADIVTFKFRYSHIYVDFGHEHAVVTDVESWVSLNDPTDTRLKTVSVDKISQRGREAMRCMAGGLMTCNKKTSRCECMNSPDKDKENWLQTELVDVKDGKPHTGFRDGDPRWTTDLACFVKINTRCAFHSFGEREDPFTCVGYNLCNVDLDMCLPPLK